MTTYKFAASFFVKQGTRITPNGTSDQFVYKNNDAHLIIDGEMDFSGNDVVLEAEKIIVTPRGSLIAENIGLIAKDILIHGKVRSNKDASVNCENLQCIAGAGWFALRKQISSFKGEEDKSTEERIAIANHSL